MKTSKQLLQKESRSIAIKGEGQLLNYNTCARETVAREGQQKIGAIYRGVASEKPSSLADAVSASVRRYRPVAFPFGVFEATAAGPAAGAHRAPFAPSAVHRGRSGAHVHALLVDAPLDSRKRNTQRPLYYLYITFVPRVGRMQYVPRATLRLVLRTNTNFQRGESREVS